MMKEIADTYTGNIGLWFYRSFFNEYFKPETPPESNEKVFAPWLKKQVDPVINSNWGVYKENFESDEMNTFPYSKFQLKTIYPGLVCGIGYEHELGFTNEFKLGFSFDHTTGLPYIPGSSVKGTLRSAFKHKGYPKSILEDWIEAIKKPNSGKSCPNELKDMSDELQIVVDQTDWQKLENHIFEGKYYSDGEPIGSYKTDVFFDAFISSTSIANAGKFLADDYITCHQNRKDALLSP
ncbi:MAG: type III-B CRISPR module RAMP protein Cmr6, partial [Flavobacteriaceae bacterium]|nr:type III-B CRISPR module RAMP protein Cmr6 [Flavobacteriaceae bacterium]